MAADGTEPFKLEKSNFIKTATLKERREHTIHFIENGATIDQCLMMLPDKIDNIRALRYDLQIIGESNWQRFNPDKDQQK
jgi:hypothetical protein